MMRDGKDATGLLPTREDDSDQRYLKAAAIVFRHAGRTLNREASLLEAASWFVGQNGRFRPSTVRQYRAGLYLYAEVALAAGYVTNSEVNETRRLLASGPFPWRGKGKTSAKKRTSADEDEIYALIRHLSVSDKPFHSFCAIYIFYAISFFLRPSEWARGSVDGHDLVVKSAKTTNGRGNGLERRIHLDGMPDLERESLVIFLQELRRLIGKHGSWKALIDAIRYVIRSACEALNIRSLAPYTLRHIGMATAKRQYTVEVVAALAGHGSDRTAASSYAKSRTGLKRWPLRLVPAKENLDAVRRTGRVSRRTSESAVEQAARSR